MRQELTSLNTIIDICSLCDCNNRACNRDYAVTTLLRAGRLGTFNWDDYAYNEDLEYCVTCAKALR